MKISKLHVGMNKYNSGQKMKERLMLPTSQCCSSQTSNREEKAEKLLLIIACCSSQTGPAPRTEHVV
jgi:hypothetical protein